MKFSVNRIAMHAANWSSVNEGGLQIVGNAAHIDCTSLKRDKRFRKVGPNTFEALDDMLIQAGRQIGIQLTAKGVTATKKAAKKKRVLAMLGMPG